MCSAPRRRLFLARDKLGKKPLYYWDQTDQVAFASNIKSVCAALPGTPPLDYQAIDAFLTFSAIPAPLTVFQGVRQLRPGEQAIFHGAGTERSRYWRLSFRDPLELSEREALDRVDGALRAAVARRLHSDAPVGVLLSGGVDSSVVAAVMARLNEHPVEAFTISSCADEPEDAPLARQVAGAIGAHHAVLPMPADSGLSHWTELVWQYGQPFGDPSALPTHAAARLARRHVTVVLTGDGGDEAFAGYPRYTWLNRVQLYSPFLANELAGTHPSDFFQTWVAEADGETDLSRTQYADFQSWLPDIMLTKVDVATMAVGLEARCPLLDEDLVQLAARLPEPFKVGTGRPAKYLLRRLIARYLPSEICSRLSRSPLGGSSSRRP
jgi:asparagine synthase (glutamine-hydrolysing)